MTKEVKQEQGELLTENGIYRLGYHNGYGFGEAYAKANAKPKEWVELTEYDIKGVLGLSESWVGEDCSIPDMIGFAKAIQAKLKEKNT